jgi:hypothetical protein
MPRDKAEGEARDRVIELGRLAVAVEMAAWAVKKWFKGSWIAYGPMLAEPGRPA